MPVIYPWNNFFLINTCKNETLATHGFQVAAVTRKSVPINALNIDPLKNAPNSNARRDIWKINILL